MICFTGLVAFRLSPSYSLRAWVCSGQSKPHILRGITATVVGLLVSKIEAASPHLSPLPDVSPQLRCQVHLAITLFECTVRSLLASSLSVFFWCKGHMELVASKPAPSSYTTLQVELLEVRMHGFQAKAAILHEDNRADCGKRQARRFDFLLITRLGCLAAGLHLFAGGAM